MNIEIETRDNQINELLEELQEKKIITEVQKEAVLKDKILKFTKSEIFKSLKNAKKVYREKAFYINIHANEIYNNDIEDPILVQGVIDLYFVDNNDRLILVDYKTDFVPDKDEGYLKQKYEKQLQLYAKALENAFGKQVDEVYIYSLYLDKEIPIY